jgi:spore coat polysaccharide biosynthesis protein SpsF
MNIGIVLLARMGSTRLPGKVLLDLEGRAVLGRVVDRLRRVRLAHPVVVATTESALDDVLVSYCRSQGIDCFRGDEGNIVDRCIRCAEAFGMEAIVRVGADCPFIDWEVVDGMIGRFLDAAAAGAPLDYVSNAMDRTFPLGLDADVMSVDVLQRLRERYRALPLPEREVCENNVIPHLHRYPQLFRTQAYRQDADRSHLRWTLDTPEDFDLVERVYRALYRARPDFRTDDILALLDEHPDWSRINAAVVPRTGYWSATEQAKWRQRYAPGPGTVSA